MLRCWICTVVSFYMTLVLLSVCLPAHGEPGHALEGKVGDSVKRKTVSQDDLAWESMSHRWDTWGVFLEQYFQRAKGSALKESRPPALVQGKKASESIDTFIRDEIKKWNVEADIIKAAPHLKDNRKAIDDTARKWRADRLDQRRKQFDDLYRRWIRDIAYDMTFDEWMALDLDNPEVSVVIGAEGSSFPRRALSDLVVKGLTKLQAMPNVTRQEILARRRVQIAIDRARAIYDRRAR